MGKYAETIISFFNNLDKTCMDLVPQFYAENATFQDPVVVLRSADQITKYYEGLYQNVENISFTFGEIIESEELVSAPWTMHLKCKKLNSNKPFSMPGVSCFKFDSISGKVIYQRDYFDMGAFIYEHVPILGTVIRVIKNKLH